MNRTNTVNRTNVNVRTGAVVVTLGATCLALLYALSALTVRYDQVTGRPPRAPAARRPGCAACAASART